MLLGLTTALATVVLATNLAADILLVYIDPRLREPATA
jgi:ABC-type dipeptide/oligopeptide/nickel transport system permease component